MHVQHAARYAAGQRVKLAERPNQEGVVSGVVGARYFVKWDNGAGFIYAGVMLEAV